MALEDEGPRTISVSRDYLRAELGGLELRLVDKLGLLATKAEVEDVDARLTKVEETVARLKGALAIVTFVGIAFGAVIVKYITG